MMKSILSGGVLEICRIQVRTRRNEKRCRYMTNPRLKETKQRNVEIYTYFWAGADCMNFQEPDQKTLGDDTARKLMEAKSASSAR